MRGDGGRCTWEGIHVCEIQMRMMELGEIDGEDGGCVEMGG